MKNSKKILLKKLYNRTKNSIILFFAVYSIVNMFPKGVTPLDLKPAFQETPDKKNEILALLTSNV